VAWSRWRERRGEERRGGRDYRNKRTTEFQCIVNKYVW
jgi:hypothetical protein